MAKKKATTKKKTTKKSAKKKKAPSKRRETWYEKKQKKAKKPDAAVLKKLGVTKCWLCDEHINGIEAFERHLSDVHETTLREYDKIYPGRAAFVPFGQQVSANQLYRAHLYRIVNGKWPEWFEGDHKIEVESADPTLLRAAANMMLTYQMQRIAPILEASIIAARRMFQAQDAATLELPDLVDFMNMANGQIKGATESIRELAEVIEKTKPKEAKGDGSGTQVRMGFVAAGTIESADSDVTEQRREVEQQKHHMTAAVSELTQAMQGYLQGGPENESDVPSKIDPPKVIDVEAVDVKTGERQAGNGSAEESPPAGPDSTS